MTRPEPEVPVGPSTGWPPPTEPLSVWALVVGIVSFFICGLIGGIAALILGSTAKKAIGASGGATGDHSVFAIGLTRVSCNSPHPAEVVGSFDAPDVAWPGPFGIGAIARPRCEDAARQYTATRPSDVGVYYLYPPTKRSWDNGKRAIVCQLGNGDGSKRVGSVRSP